MSARDEADEVLFVAPDAQQRIKDADEDRYTIFLGHAGPARHPFGKG